MEPARVFDGDHLRVLHLDRGNPRLMVTFDFRTLEKDNFGPVNASKAFAKAGFDQLMIKTRRNDWFINRDTLAMEQTLGPLTARYDRVHALGYSMGGYGALRFATSLRADWIVAVSPQASIAPDVVPFDRRYKTEAKTFDPTIGTIPAIPALPGLIVFDPFIRPDLRHARLLQSLAPTLTLARASFGGHPASRVLRDVGRGGVIQRAAMQAVKPARVAKAHRAGRLKSPLYLGALSKAAGARWPELAAFCAKQTKTIQQNAQAGGDSG